MTVSSSSRSLTRVVLPLILSFAFVLSGCSGHIPGQADSSVVEDAAETDDGIRVLEEPEIKPLSEPSSELEVELESQTDQEPISESGAPAYSYTNWSEEVAPEYYRIVDYSQVESSPAAGTAVYAPLDTLGRAGQAMACVTYEMMEAGRARDRKSLSGISPSGWGHNEEVDIVLVDGNVYHGLFWNRSHLIAKSLGGDDVVENLVTGTRMQNVGCNRGGGTSGGMAYCENLARMWLEDNQDGTLTYVATPVYEGDELVCRSVIVDMLSSDGQLDVRIEVYNAAKGYEVNYADGTFVASAE